MKTLKQFLFVLIILSFTTLSFAAKKQTCEIPPSMKELAKDLAGNSALEDEFNKSSPDKVKSLGEAWVFFNKRKDKNKTNPKVLTAYVSMTETLNSSNASNPAYKGPAASNAFVVDKNGKVFSTKKVHTNIDKGLLKLSNLNNLGVTKPDDDTYIIVDKDKMMNQIKQRYKDRGINLHPDIEKLIYSYVSKNVGKVLQQREVGVPGLHSEVLALNDLYNQVGGAKNIKQGYVQTFHTDGTGHKFPACNNCSGIIPNSFDILTGKK